MKIRNFLLSLLFVLLLATQSFAFRMIGHQGWRLVANGTFTAANARNNFVNGTAFVEASGLDLSTYAGTDVGSTLYFIQLQDASGDIAQGYLGAIGGGETLGAELLTNPTFDVNTNGWVANSDACTLASIAGGQSNNCLELTMVSGSGQIARSSVSLAKKALYKVSTYYKSGTSGNEGTFLGERGVSGGPWDSIAYATTSNIWQTQNGYGVIIDATPTIWLGKNSATAGTMLFDEPSFKQVTDCAVTGLHIMSVKNGTTRNWYNISATFGYNDAMTYRIYKVY